MAREDIANVVLIEDQELADLCGMILDCVPLQVAANDYAGRWGLGDVDPELFDVSDVPPFRSPDAFERIPRRTLPK